MRGPAVFLFVLALVCVHTPSGTSGSTCVTPKSSSMGIAVVSRRNETGHWTAQLNFTHDSDGAKGREKGSGPWLVNFDQTVSVCEEGESVLIVATLTSACKEESVNKTPPRGFMDVPGLNKYKVHVTAKTWEEARKVCIAEKAHLVVINSEAEAKAVLKIWQEYPFPKLNPLFIFLGFNDIKGEGKYVTVTGEPLEDTGFVAWEKGQPDDSRGENCGGLNRSGKLHDLSCTTKIPYICEQEKTSYRHYDKFLPLSASSDATDSHQLLPVSSEMFCPTTVLHEVRDNQSQKSHWPLGGRGDEEGNLEETHVHYRGVGIEKLKKNHMWNITLNASSRDSNLDLPETGNTGIGKIDDLYRVATGAVNLKHSAGSTTSVEQDSGPWEVDVEQTSSRCGAEEEIVLAALVKAPPPRAGPGYETIHGLGYYKLHTELSPWEEARRVCAEEGAHLAVVNSKVEMDVILNIWGRHPNIMDSYLNSFAHVGFHDLYTEGNYLTVLGDSLLSTGFVPWGTNEPNNVGGSPGEDCGSLLRDGKLNDINCDTKLAYFCEQESWPFALLSASLKPILWDGEREGERRGVASQPTQVSFHANKKRWITKIVDGASYRTEEVYLYSNLDLSFIGSLVNCESSALEHAATEAGKLRDLQKDHKFIPGVGYYKLRTELKYWDKDLNACIKDGTSTPLETSTPSRISGRSTLVFKRGSSTTTPTSGSNTTSRKEILSLYQKYGHLVYDPLERSCSLSRRRGLKEKGCPDRDIPHQKGKNDLVARTRSSTAASGLGPDDVPRLHDSWSRASSRKHLEQLVWEILTLLDPGTPSLPTTRPLGALDVRRLLKLLTTVEVAIKSRWYRRDVGIGRFG
uniref:C-type lectin domain-containing protein n=1 Tax=Timema shepardi TaxID=629360 RepID=A0A7R9AT92_TIMSH|nr:unnamed protein product [Timema shepardi]